MMEMGYAGEQPIRALEPELSRFVVVKSWLGLGDQPLGKILVAF